MAVAERIRKMTGASSWVRRMFEEAAQLKRELGEDRVCDFTLGNPIEEPPPSFKEGLKRLASEPLPGMHRYMPNSGYPETRSFIAEQLRQETGLPFTEDHIVMSVGAAGGLNVLLKAILNEGEEVIVPSPYFVEFQFYIANHGGRIVLVDTRDDFSLDVEAIARAIDEETRAILINSPNNPTGVVYSEEELRELGEVLKEKSRGREKPLYLISDDTYKTLVYNGRPPLNVFNFYEATVSVFSYSKSLNIPGERIGYVAINPLFSGAGELMDALTFTTRSLGFVNAPALMQRLIPLARYEQAAIKNYQRKRDLLYEALTEFGYEVVKPGGAFYMFPKTPIEDDMAFVADLQRNFHILTVPGRGFGRGGHFRISYCVEMEVIERSLEGFREAAKKYGLY
ncbi:MAG: pyridoxal phosphate-dependent aminotransferase [Deltaproteobacteria bacterium]|nr:MAG: pyridoxal phosphate-dependent aminotransferase [Deltaproteobacteria bacterium]